MNSTWHSPARLLLIWRAGQEVQFICCLSSNRVQEHYPVGSLRKLPLSAANRHTWKFMSSVYEGRNSSPWCFNCPANEMLAEPIQREGNRYRPRIQWRLWGTIKTQKLLIHLWILIKGTKNSHAQNLACLVDMQINLLASSWLWTSTIWTPICTNGPATRRLLELSPKSGSDAVLDGHYSGAI